MIAANLIPECFARYEKKLPNDSFYIGENIPEKKRKNAVKAYGDPSIGTVHALYDATVFGSAKEGIMFTDRSLYYHYFFGKWAVDYDDIDHMEIEQIDPGRPDPSADILHIFTGSEDRRLSISGLNKCTILAILEEICGFGSVEERTRFDMHSYMQPDPYVATTESRYFQKHRCIYCNSRTTVQDGKVFCRSCGRVNEPIAQISILNFEPIPEEFLRLLRAKEPGFFDTLIHEEMISAAADGRLRIAEAVSDGYYDSELRYDSELTESEQFIRSPDGVPIEGCFYSYPLQKEACPVWVIQLEKRDGKKHYVLLSKEKHDQLAETLANIENNFIPTDEYDPKRRCDGL